MNKKIKIFSLFLFSVLAIGGIVYSIRTAQASAPNWNTTGTYAVNVNYLSVDYPESLVLTQVGGSITGGTLNTVPVSAGGAFTVTGGTVSGNSVDFDLTNDSNPSLTDHFTGTVAVGGSMSGTWADTPGFGRSGTWATTSGAAIAIAPSVNFLVDDDHVQCPTATYTTIGAAVAAASSGDVITVCAGNYPEQVSVNKSLTINGSNAGTAGNAGRGAEAVVDGANTSTPFVITADNVTIDGFTVKNGSNGSYFAGIWSETGTMNSKIQNNIITDNGFGIWAQCGGNCLIEKNLFDGNNDAGPGNGSISADATNGLTINNNEFRNETGGNPILLQATGANMHTNLVISNNNFHGNAFSNIYAVGLNGGNIHDNTITPANDSTGISFTGASTNVTVTKNIITNGARGVRINDDVSAYGNSSNISVNRNSLASDSDFGAGNLAGYTGNLDATCNWWGAANGPGTVGTGSGSPVTSNVTFAPWLTTSDLNSGPCNGNPSTAPVPLADFCDLRRPNDISVGPDLGGTGHSALNFTGSTGSAGDTWISIYNPSCGSAPTYGSVTLDADVLIHPFNNNKGGGVLALFNQGTGMSGLSLIINDAGNTDKLVLSSVNSTTGKQTMLKSIPLGAGGIAENKWYHLKMVVNVSGGSVTVTGDVSKHLVSSDPGSALNGAVGNTLSFTGLLPSGVTSPGEIGIIANATSAVVDTSVTNFTINGSPVVTE